MSKRKNQIVALGIVAAGAAGLVSAGALGAGREMAAASPRAEGAVHSTDGATRTIRAEGYVVDLSLQQQLDFPGTALAFQGVVTDVLESRRVEVEGLEYVYTPVVVTVSKMYKGERPSDNKVVLRALGGTADGLTYEAEFAPSQEITNRGVMLIVLGPEPVVVSGDKGMLAMTPNGVHVVHGGKVIDATHSERHQGHEERKLGISHAESILSAR